MDRRLSMTLRNISASVVLRLLMRQAVDSSSDIELVLEVQPTYIELLTKDQANRRPIVRVYDVRDLLMTMSFDDDEHRPTRREKAQELIQLIRDTIEPDLWAANGGDVATIRYYNGRLIIKAPQYMHGQVR